MPSDISPMGMAILLGKIELKKISPVEAEIARLKDKRDEIDKRIRELELKAKK